MKHVKYLIVLLVVGFALAACGDGDSSDTTTTTQATTTTAQATTTTAAIVEGDVVTGGLLYDQWWKVLALDAPADDNPLWASQTTNERSGADTWRCKECHGWDYKGAEGAYGSGSHQTGFTGIWEAQSKSLEDLVAQLSGQVDPDHDFSVMGEEAMADLATFIKEGLDDYTPMIDADKNAVGGDAAHGEELYTSTCAACHDADGTLLNFGSDDEPEYVGTIAVDNPWEFFHKIRMGQPGTPMPSAITSGWSLDDVLDVLTYAQTLPIEAGAAQLDAIVLGGLLYDQWWKVLDVDAPADDNPLWASQTTNERSGADTWRCKECHGWDYKGAEGAYGSGSHMTGFPGIWEAQDWDEEQLIAQIEGKSDPEHDFSAFLGHDETQALAAFITAGLDDYTPMIDADKNAVGGDAAHGEELYTSTCAACHDADGTLLNFGSDDEPEYVGTIAVDNPWEFFHKIRMGQPGTPMPSAITSGWSLDDVLDVLTFAQTLPSE
ncbi:MAG: cytochrome c [Acidimicrobiia bacterium]|nr:cytochrome c [Acidimicrobiia bacterium]